MKITVVLYRKFRLTIITRCPISELCLAEFSRLCGELPLLIRETLGVAVKNRDISHGVSPSSQLMGCSPVWRGNRELRN